MMLTRRGMVRGSAALAVIGAGAPAVEVRPPLAGVCQALPAASPAVVALNRLSFGAAPGELAAFNALGATSEERYEAWVTRQLSPACIDDSVCEQRLARTRLKIRYGAVNETRPLSLLDAPMATLWPLREHVALQERIRPYEEVRVATWLRAVYSRRQLFEILVDFWHNHFNVRAASDSAIMATWPIYDRLIRTHALGNFRTFVEEVGKSVAMMLYLDNARNMAAGGEGGNESYARELFELHTLGAEHYLKFYSDRGQIPTVSYGGETYPAGYIDDDVYEASRCLAGWTIANGCDGRPNTGAFSYLAGWHDTYPKTVLAARPLEGEVPAPNIPPRQAELKDGQDVFDLLCNHPGTARHLCTKLARRLIADNPPQAVVDAAVETWMANREAPDQIARVLATILRSRECRTTYGRKVRRPLETVWAYLRATGAELPSDTTDEDGDPGRGGYWSSLLYRADLTGHRLFGWETPNGHPDLASYWVNTNGVLRRWNMFYTVTQSWGGNLKIDLVGQTDLTQSCVQIVDVWTARLCGFTLTGGARQELISFLAAGGDPEEPPAPSKGAPDYGAAKAIGERLTAMIHLLAMSPDFNLR